MSERVNIGKTAPQLYQAVIGLDKLAAEAVALAGLSDGFAHLLRLRASQLNQCAFCVGCTPVMPWSVANPMIALAFCQLGEKLDTSMTRNVLRWN